MAKFDTDILEIEGYGYTNDPLDAGGETKYGISKRSYPNEDIKNMTPDRAIEIYTRDFWNPNRLSEIQDQTTANIIFRYIVHAGKQPAVSLLQNCLNSFVPIISMLRVDGQLGQAVLQAIGSIRPLRLQESLRLAVITEYMRIVTKNPSQEKYLKGWINRALS